MFFPWQSSSWWPCASASHSGPGLRLGADPSPQRSLCPMTKGAWQTHPTSQLPIYPFNTVKSEQTLTPFCSRRQFQNAFSCMKIVVFWFKFHQNLLPRVWSPISQHWFRKWLGAKQAATIIWTDDIYINIYMCAYIDGLVQERSNSIANTLELRLSCTNPSICMHHLSLKSMKPK